MPAEIRSAILLLDGYAGRREHPCEIIGETAQRYRIQVRQQTPLAGANRWLQPGQTALVPKHAVRLDQAAEKTPPRRLSQKP